MRKELEVIRQIDKYLKNEMPVDDRKDFEERLRSDKSLQKEVEIQKETIKGIERIGVKESIRKAYSKYRFGKTGFNLGLGFIVVGALVSTFLWYSSNNYDPIVCELPELNELGEPYWVDADKYLRSQRFILNTDVDTVIESQEGIVMYIPSGAFVDDKGNEIDGEVELEIKEALSTAQILQAGLSSKSGEKLLESAGMFYVNARRDGKTVHINPEKGIYTEIPTDEVNPNMQLFEGKRMSDSSIDWINPSPLGRSLTTFDIQTLNFYPTKYEPRLAELGYDVSNKEFKDSLYYSFAFEKKNENQCLKAKIMGSKSSYYDQSQSSCLKKNIDWSWSLEPVGCDEYDVIIVLGSIHKFKTRFHTFFFDITRKQNNIELIGKSKNHLGVGDKKKSSIDFDMEKFKFTETYRQRVRLSREGKCKLNFEVDLSSFCDRRKNKATIIIDLNIGLESPKTIDCDQKLEKSFRAKVCGINPAKIKTIWSNEFNNTLISTREFEERLKVIFSTCNDEVLDLYINNMSLEMYKIDSMAAVMTIGDLRKRFLEFSRRKDGKVEIDVGRNEKLRKHYRERQKIIAEAIAKTKGEFNQKNKELDAIAKEKRKEFSKNESVRKEDNFVEEFNVNLTEAYKQLGRPKPKRYDAEAIYKLTLKRGGWKNVDAYVMGSIAQRETMDYEDSLTGKKALIKYESISVNIKDAFKYDRLLAYILPDKLNSFIRMKKEEVTYKEKLNELMTNDLVCLGYIGEQAYFFLKENVEPQIYNEIELKSITEKELDKSLKGYDESKKENMLKEIDYQLFEAKDIQRQKKIFEKQRLIVEIKSVIFPCGERDPVLNE